LLTFLLFVLNFIDVDNQYMAAIELNPRARKEKRGEAHHLDPVVMIGGDGLTSAVLREADSALNAHGLIKIRVFSDDRAERESLLAQLSDQLGAAPIQHIGKLLVLWRPVPDPVSAQATDRMPGPRVVKLVTFSKSGNHRPQVKKVKVLGNQRITSGGTIKRAKARSTSLKKKAQT
jgi:putative YhbY family RNA-binding protein